MTLHSVAEDAAIRAYWLEKLEDELLWLGFRDSNVSSFKAKDQLTELC